MKKLADVFKDLEKQKWSGRLTLTASEGYAYFYLSFGKLFFSHRPIDRANEKIAKVQWMNSLDEDLVQEIDRWEEYVRLLLKANREQAEAVVRYLKREKLELFYRCFFWTNVEITPEAFDVRTEDFPDLAFLKPKSIDGLLKEANQRSLEWPRIQQKIGSSKRIFISRMDFGETGSRKAKTDEIDRALADFETTGGKLVGFDFGPFGEEELHLLQLCDGSNTVNDLVLQSEEGEFLTLRRLVMLWDKGIVYPKDIDPSAQTMPPAERQIVWTKEIAGFLFLSTFFVLLAAGLWGIQNYLNPPVKREQSLRKSIEIYRGLYGRYPVSLGEMEEPNILQGPDLSSFFEYRLINLKDYELHSRP